MPVIPLTDAFGLTIDLSFDEESAAARFGLRSLTSKTEELVAAATKPLDQTTLRSVVLGGTFTNGSLTFGHAGSLTVKPAENVTLTVFRSGDEPVFDDDSPIIPQDSSHAWVSVAFDTSLVLQAAAVTPSGFGVSGKSLVARRIATYALIARTASGFPNLKTAWEHALSRMRVLTTAADIRKQPLDTVCEWDVSGGFTLEGSYGIPFGVNASILAGLPLPLHSALEIQPQIVVQFTGAVSVSGEFRGRCYRTANGKAQLGLFKQRGSDLSASFTAQAGIGAFTGTTDVIGPLLKALASPDVGQVSVPSADRASMNAALGAALDTGFTIAVNAAGSASVTEEAVVLYEIDLHGDSPDFDRALESALKGNWTAFAHRPETRVLRNVLTQVHERTRELSLNLLGLYNAVSLDDFVRRSSVLHDEATGTITMTDVAEAQHLALVATPFASDDEKLRRVLDESFIATAAYIASGAGLRSGPMMEARQTLLTYYSRTHRHEIRKALLFGGALDLVSPSELAVPVSQQDFRYFRLAATAVFSPALTLSLFFSDVQARIPHARVDLQNLGRRVLASLLDLNDSADRERQMILGDESWWIAMDRDHKYPPHSPASYSDWYDITFWADALSAIAPVLKKVLDLADRLGPVDPAKDQSFLAAWQALSKALAGVARQTHAAFEKGWPIAAMFALSGNRAPVTFTAQWDGEVRFDRRTQIRTA